ncbi:hypothetical protein K7G98_07305 [Saccharothrix sp. MB29]|nr:hypothetical protein [Saccharothrix sp. MB29]
MHTTTRTTIAVDALAALFPHRVATAADLLSLGLGSEELSRRCRPRGGWQHVLPGVLLLSDQPPTRPQLVQAALRHCGTGSIVTGLDALQLHGMRALPAHGPVHVLVTRPVDPSTRVRATRTRHPPDPVLRRGFLTAPLARAAADAARTLETRDDIRAVLTEALRRGGVAVDDLRPHLSRASAPAKRVLAELAEGVRSAPQAWARSLVAGLPLPPRGGTCACAPPRAGRWAPPTPGGRSWRSPGSSPPRPPTRPPWPRPAPSWSTPRRPTCARRRPKPRGPCSPRQPGPPAGRVTSAWSWRGRRPGRPLRGTGSRPTTDCGDT